MTTITNSTHRENLHKLSKFHGWWKTISKDQTAGFDNGFYNQYTIGNPDIDSYIFIDTNKTPIIITTCAGTSETVFQPKPNQIAGDPTYALSSDGTALVSLVIATGDDVVSGNLYHTLQLQEDSQTLVCQTDGGFTAPDGTKMMSASSDYVTTLILKKLHDSPPCSIPSFDISKEAHHNDHTRLTVLFKYLFERQYFHEGNMNRSYNTDVDCISEARKKLDMYLTEGRTFISKITKIRKTFNQSGMTGIYTDRFNFVTPGSDMTITGLGNTWAVINGHYVNGAGIHCFGGVPNPSSDHVDVGTWPFHFYLRSDTSSLDAFVNNDGYPQYANGVATCKHFGSNSKHSILPSVTVTHKVTDDMSYSAFYAAVYAMFYDIFKVNQHHGIGPWLANSGDPFIPTTWKELQTALTPQIPTLQQEMAVFPNLQPLTSTAVSVPCRSRTNMFLPQYFYKNAAILVPYISRVDPQPGYAWHFNDPYGLFPVPGGLYDYDVIVNNYLVGVRNLYYTLDGTPTTPLQSILGLAGYKNMIGDTTGGAYFTSTTTPYNVTDPGSGNPDPNVWTLMGGAFDGSDAEAAANALHFGFVDPTLSNGKKIGYIYLGDTSRTDVNGLMTWAAMLKSNEYDSPRQGLEGFARVFSAMMIYLQSDSPLDGLIIDDRLGAGGTGSQSFVVGSLFGGKRPCVDKFVQTWVDNSEPKSISELGYKDYANIDSLLHKQCEFIYADETAKRYGNNAVFTNGPVVALHSAGAASGNDEIIRTMYLGKNAQKDVGSGVHVKIIGDVDGRLKGATLYDFSDNLPFKSFDNPLITNFNTPVAAIGSMRSDETLGSTISVHAGIPISIQDKTTAIDAAPTLKGWSGGNPLPDEYESTVYVDFGFMTPHPDAPLPGWKNDGQVSPSDSSTFCDRWFEQAILSVIADIGVTTTIKPPFCFKNTYVSPFQVNAHTQSSTDVHSSIVAAVDTSSSSLVPKNNRPILRNPSRYPESFRSISNSNRHTLKHMVHKCSISGHLVKTNDKFIKTCPSTCGCLPKFQ
jgi:hypothetical protein